MEFDVAYKFNFDYPKLMNFATITETKKDKFGNSLGYKLANKGMTTVDRPPKWRKQASFKLDQIPSSSHKIKGQ